MKTIKSNIINEIEVKNSRFICYLIRINDSLIDQYLDAIKKEYPKATHYCYAYIFDNINHCSDDGEPSGTAGRPILNVLEKEGLNHILCVVVRYFGGIKLGAGGLVRAYTKSVTEALKECSYEELVQGYEVELTFNYEDENNILYILNNSIITSKEYRESIKYTCLIDLDIFNKLSKYNPKIIEETYVKKLN